MALADTAPETWDLVRVYNASTHIFYGEVVKTVPEPNYKTGVLGVHPREIDGDQLPAEQPIVWQRAKELTFKVDAALKGELPPTFAAYLPDPSVRLWKYVKNDVGDVFLAKPDPPDEQLLNLEQGDQGLFYVRPYLGSTIPVVYRMRLGRGATEDRALLESHRAAKDHLALEQIVEDARAREAAKAKQEAAEFKKLEDEYYKILRIQDLEIRRSMLNGLIQRMGFEGLWTYFKFKDRYLKEHGAHVPTKDIPSGPSEGKEKLWHDASGELRKIEVILDARAR